KARPNTWTYELKMDQKTRMRKSEVLSHGKVKAVLTTYVHASNYDSLRFIGPDGRAYIWVSSSQVSSIGASRYDTVRHALFVATGHIPDPLYGQIVADHTFWDGYVDPSEALYIRSSTVDPSLVVATLQVLKDWEKHTLREEKRDDEKGFLASQEAARKCDLGAMSYWKA
ncbi:hypothetical protein T440DRAFT_374570, partial [Plenodomus tracheiphilus IPT5]